MRDVILHAFDWKFTHVAESARAIAGVGYGAVLLSPPLYSAPDGPEWWQRYQPKDYRILRSHLGGKGEFIKAIEALHAVGVRAYVDVVFNHMANEKGVRGDPYAFPGEAELARYKASRASFEDDRLYGDLDAGLFSPLDFNPSGDIHNWHDLHESQQHELSGLPDLQLNDWVVDQQRECLRALSALGVDGYRIDAIKHLATEHITRVFQTTELEGKFVFGEALTSNDTEENLFLWPLVRHTRIAFYDFALHETLRRVFAPAGSLRELVDPAAYGQALPWDRAVTFSVTHDIPNNDGFRWQLLDKQDEFLANVYLLCRDGGSPLVFSDHNESARKYPEDRDRWAEAWKREDTAHMVAFHNAVHGLPQRTLHESDGVLAFARGDRSIVAINKTADWHDLELPAHGLKPGRYRCKLYGWEIPVSGELVTFAIPPRQALLWLCQ